MFRSLLHLLKNIRHNAWLYRSGKANKNKVQYTAIGWRPDESYTESSGETASGSVEYTKINQLE